MHHSALRIQTVSTSSTTCAAAAVSRMAAPLHLPHGSQRGYPWCGPFLQDEEIWDQRIKGTGQSCHCTGAKDLNAEIIVCIVLGKAIFSAECCFEVGPKVFIFCFSFFHFCSVDTCSVKWAALLFLIPNLAS